MADEEIMVKATKISFDNPKLVNQKAQLKAELQLIAKPTPNYGLGGFNLWVYNLFHDLKKEKGFRPWIKKTLGRPPQIYSPTVVRRSTLVLEKYLKDNGYFGAKVYADTLIKGQEMTIDYQVRSNGQFKIKNLYFPADTTPIGQLINQHKEDSKIDTATYYSKLALDEERLRLTKIIGNEGCIDFQENFLYFVVDTTKERLAADIYIDVQNPTDTALYRTYTIGETYVYPAYLLNDSLANNHLDTIFTKKTTIIQPSEVVRPSTLNRAILQRKDHLVKRDLQDIAVKHLLDLGVFKFVRLQYRKRNSNNAHLLDRYFYLTPGLTQSVQYEFQVNNRSGDFFGSAASVQYSHNNLFRGAEQFSIKLSGGLETQLQNKESLINTVDLSIEASLSVPKLVVPFKFRNRSFFYVPKTRVSLSNNFQVRSTLYTINAASLKAGYEWQQGRKIRHQFNPLRMSLLSVSNESDDFLDILAENTRLKNSFGDEFIVGSNYIFTYNSKPKNKATPYTYFRTEVGTSGNVVSLFANELPGVDGTDSVGIFLTRAYAQFIKFAPDFRYYIPRGKKLIASRLFFGIGIPYRNSEELPYIEQFFVGGSNSVRAFRIRELGPGSFLNDTISSNNSQLIDQTGDIKLELSLEYRYNIIKYLDGAVFLDAGNVWLLKSDDRPNGVFEFDRFYKEIAIGTGFGLRLDLDFFVLRFDIACPLRKPITNGQFGWTFDDLAIYKRSWRQDNLVYNLAIGYPF